MLVVGKVYAGRITKRPCGYDGSDEQKNNLDIYPPEVIDVIAHHENLCKEKEQLSFTTIVIQLRESIREQLQINKRYDDLPDQISEIYYFHLHPEYRPNNANEYFCRAK